MSDADTRVLLTHAFEGPGLPPNVFPELDQDTWAEFLGVLAMVYIDALPRKVRRAFSKEDTDLLHDVIMRALGRGFWAGAAFVVERDKG